MRAAKSWARAVLARVPSSGQLGCALLLHLSGPKRAKIAAVLERAAVATHLRILDERLLCVAFRSDLVNVRLELRHGGFTAHVRRRLAGAARDWVARAAKLDEKVACLILRRHIGARTFWISRRRSTTVSGCRVRYRERGSHVSAPPPPTGALAFAPQYNVAPFFHTQRTHAPTRRGFQRPLTIRDT